MNGSRDGSAYRPRAAMRAILGGALVMAIGTGLAAAATPAVVDRFPGIAPAYALSVDGRLTWGGNLDTPRPPASLVKVLTAMTLLAEDWQPDAEVAVSRRAADIEGSQVGLRAGERVRASDLLTAMLVRSGNDACVALVEKAAGTLEAFLPRLNERARELGLSASRFEHPCGLDADGTRTTARDLLRLAEAAIGQPQIALRARASEARIVTLGGREIRFHNSNALIGRDPDTVGLKSGFTQRAGRCLIAVAERDGHRVILVMLGADERWWAASNLLVLGLAQAGAAP